MGIANDIVITPQQMRQMDDDAAKSGISTMDLMERAGAAVAASALRYFPEALRCVVLCGPGNNGGDGFVAARYLRQSGCEVAVYGLVDQSQLKGDARQAAALWQGDVLALEDYRPQKGDLIIDALFGAGLARPLDAALANLIASVEGAAIPVLSVDLPSGISGSSGAVLGSAFTACRSVTFAALKLGHVLEPGASHCGEIELVDIGIPERIIRRQGHGAKINNPTLWASVLPRLDNASHKYKRGHLTVFSGSAHSSGAARLCAQAALGAGAGIVAIAAPDDKAADMLASRLTAIMQVTLGSRQMLEGWLADKRHQSFVIGPGFGDISKLLDNLALLSAYRLVLDADALTAISRNSAYWFDLFSQAGVRIMTPHEGEFARLFPKIATDEALSKVDKALAAARISHSVIVYKGADSVIAAPDGRVVINRGAPPTLATAGSGDVLAGICGAHLALGIPGFEAACAAVWLHSEAARRGPANLNAERLAQLVSPYTPEV